VRFLPLRRTGMADAEWTALGSGFGVDGHERFYRKVAERQRQGKAAVSVSCGLSGFILKPPREVADDEIWCPVGRKIDIEANGDAYPCVLLMEERFRLGNVHRESLASMTRSGRMRQVCHSLVARRSTIGRCASCLWRNLCQAGCMGQALDNAGTIEAVDDFCRYRQKVYAEAFDLILAQESRTGRCEPHR
jgi:radical SAM protein with 4Fe4S-binding SPASM domain